MVQRNVDWDMQTAGLHRKYQMCFGLAKVQSDIKSRSTFRILIAESPWIYTSTQQTTQKTVHRPDSTNMSTAAVVKFRYISMEMEPSINTNMKVPLFYNKDSVNMYFAFYSSMLSACSFQQYRRGNTKTTANHTCKCNSGYQKWTNTIWIHWSCWIW